MPHRGIVGLPLFERRGEEGLQFAGDGGGPFFRPLSTYAPPGQADDEDDTRARSTATAAPPAFVPNRGG